MKKTPNFERIDPRAEDNSERPHWVVIGSGALIAAGMLLGAGLLGQAFGLWPGLVPFDHK